MFKHYTVMKKEVIDYLNIKPDGIYVDATMGGGGHSRAILEKLTTGTLYCFDQDQDALQNAVKSGLSTDARVVIIDSNFSNLQEQLLLRDVKHIDGIVFDLGVSSYQFDTQDRGFSYRFDAYLDMRMDQRQSLKAYDVVNTYDVAKLAAVFEKYGDEKFGFAISKNIIKHRQLKPIETTFELVEIIKEALPMAHKRKKKHPAKKCFQALRIEVNGELEVFEKALKDAVDMLNLDGVAVVITFHSLEDKLCKYLFNQYVKVNTQLKQVPIMNDIDMPYEILTRKALLPSTEELEENNRSHSAMMRAIRRRV